MFCPTLEIRVPPFVSDLPMMLPPVTDGSVMIPVFAIDPPVRAAMLHVRVGSVVGGSVVAAAY